MIGELDLITRACFALVVAVAALVGVIGFTSASTSVPAPLSR